MLSGILPWPRNTKVKTELSLYRPRKAHRRGRTASPPILYLGTGWRWVVKCTPRPLGETRNRSGYLAEKSVFLTGIQSRHRPTRILVTIPARSHPVPDLTSKHGTAVFQWFLQHTCQFIITNHRPTIRPPPYVSTNECHYINYDRTYSHITMLNIKKAGPSGRAI